MKRTATALFTALLITASSLAAYAVAPAPANVVCPVSSTLKVFPDTKLKCSGEAYKMSAARNEYSPFQVAVHSRAGLKNVNVAVSDISGPRGVIVSSGVTLNIVETVVTEEPSMSDKRKVWPDPLPPLRSFNIAPGETRAVWIDLFVPAGTAPGDYSGRVSITGDGGERFSIPFSLKVTDVEIPTVPTLRTAFGIGYGSIRAAHKTEKDSPEEIKLFDKYYWFLVQHRLSPYSIPVDLYSDEAHRYLDDPRVNYLRPPYSGNDDELKRMLELLKSTGWDKKAVYYVRDEPTLEKMKEVTQIGKRLKSFDPDIKYLITTGGTKNLKDAGIDVWCPSLQYTADPNSMRYISNELKKGKKFWWYTCIGPKWPGTTYFIDEAGTAPRTLPWMNYLYNVTGILYWQTSSWGRAGDNPWLKTETYPGGNGDGSLLYPGSHVGYDGPVASMRLKLIREGIEDNELLGILSSRLSEAAARIGGPATGYDAQHRLYEHAFSLIKPDGRRSPLGKKTPFLMYVSRDYHDIEARRDAVLRETETALRSPLLLVSTDPEDGGFTKKASATVSGYVEAGAVVTVNGKKTVVKDRTFSAVVPLKKGENTIKVSAKLGGAEKTAVRYLNRF